WGAARRPGGHGRRRAAAGGGATRRAWHPALRRLGQRRPPGRRRVPGAPGGRRPGRLVTAPRRRGGRPQPAPAARPDARRTAVEALVRIERDGAYANLVLPKVLASSGLPDRDRAFATELV